MVSAVLLAAAVIIGPYGVTQDSACSVVADDAIVEVAEFLALSDGSTGASPSSVVNLSQSDSLRQLAAEIEARDSAFRKVLDLAQCALLKQGSAKVRQYEGVGKVEIGDDLAPGRRQSVCIGSDGRVTKPVDGQCLEVPAVR